MSQNDFTIANQGFPAFRADLNSALQALASNNSGATEPSTMFANMWWYDTSNNIMYIRNEDNDAWIKFAELDQTNDKFVLSGTLQLDDGTVSAPALTFNSDTNMGIYRGGTDILKFVTAGTDAITIDASQDVTLAGSLNFANNEKALFGAGSDLQIYHDGGNSRIDDAGSGRLIIRGNGGVSLEKYTGATLAIFNADGASSLYYNNSPKLATTDTGIDVTGTVVSDGMSTNTAGSGNFIAGLNAGDAIVSGGNNNVLVGNDAGTALTTGDSNVALGWGAFSTEDASNKNTAIGTIALRNQNVAGDAYNTAVGFSAGVAVTTGVNNTLIGGLAGDALTDADNNTAIGYNALSADTLGSRSTAIGYNTLLLQNFTSATNVYNVAIGHDAGRAITTALYSTIIGGLAGVAHQTGNFNTYIGYASGTANTGDQNTLIGANAGYLLTNADKNTIIGKYNGNQGGLDIRTSSNYIVLSDGDGNPRGVFDNSGNFLVGKASTDITVEGVVIKPTDTGGGMLFATSSGERVAILNRNTDDGGILEFRKDNTVVGSISSNWTSSTDFTIKSNTTRLILQDGGGEALAWDGSFFHPWTDNAIDLGYITNRWDDVYATNGTIQTSDRNEKQDIEELSEAEQRVAIVAKGLMRKFRWIDSVAEKGDNARTHFGIIAQDLQDAFTAEGLDASKYAMFTSNTWWEKEISVDAVEADEENGIEAQDAYTYIDIKNEATEGYTEKTRLGVRYNQLLAFIISAI